MNTLQLRNRKQKMISMRNEKKTLQEIADKFGITRERVRQIIGNTGGEAIKKRMDDKLDFVKSNPQKTNSELIEDLRVKFGAGLGKLFFNIRSKTRHAIDGGALQLGVEAEIIVSEKLNSLGIKHQLMPHHHVFDIQLENGKTVDVKSRINQSIAPSAAGRLKTPQWRFVARKEKKGNYTDFFILYIWATKDFFVVPNEDVHNDQIVFCWPPKKPSKWHKYHNRFDLLTSH